MYQVSNNSDPYWNMYVSTVPAFSFTSACFGFDTTVTSAVESLNPLLLIPSSTDTLLSLIDESVPGSDLSVNYTFTSHKWLFIYMLIMKANIPYDTFLQQAPNNLSYTANNRMLLNMTTKYKTYSIVSTIASNQSICPSHTNATSTLTFNI